MALGYYLSAIDCAQRTGYRRTLAGIYSNISLLFSSHNDTSGLRYCRESYRISRQTGKPEDVYYPACNLATVHLLRGDLHNAYKYASEAADISDRHSLLRPELAGILMGSVLGRMGRTDEALDRLDKAILSLKSLNPSSSLLVQAYFEKARISMTRRISGCQTNFAAMLCPVPKRSETATASPTSMPLWPTTTNDSEKRMPPTQPLSWKTEI